MKQKTGRGMKQDFTKQYLVYERWCRTCVEEEEEKTEKEEIREEEKEKKKKIKIHKSIGEIAQSEFEKGC